MVVDTPHGEFEVKDITRKERRKYYKKVKKVFTSENITDLLYWLLIMKKKLMKH